MNANTNSNFKKIFVFLSILAILVNIKAIFTDYNTDSGYAIAMSYRILQGDAMISQMWEPHQTSAFLCTFFIWLYTALTKTTTGLVLFLHTIGVFIKALLSYVIYQTLKPHIHQVPLKFMCLFFFMVNPKGLLLPEFSNMQLWFSVCLFCCLIKYLNSLQQKKYLLLSGFFLCLEIISYPSCIIVYIGVFLIIWLYSQTKWTDILLVTGECFLLGFAYISYFVHRLGWSVFFTNCRHIITGDSTHDNSLLTNWLGYTKELGNGILLFLLIGTIALLLAKICSTLKAFQSVSFYKLGWCIFFLLAFMCDFYITITAKNSYFERFPIYAVILVFSLIHLRNCNDTEQKIYKIGFIISGFGFLATLLLTNLSLEATLNYLILAVMVAFLPLTKFGSGTFSQSKPIFQQSILFIFLLLTVFHNSYVIKCMGNTKTNIFDIGSIVKSGPAIGIVSEYMGPYIMNTTIKECHEWLQPNDRVLIVSAETLDPLMYLYQNEIEISIDSTICTPTFNEKLLTYWQQNPDKKPNVVLLECWYGDLHISEDSWIMNWLSSEFDLSNYKEGSYWRYYRK